MTQPTVRDQPHPRLYEVAPDWGRPELGDLMPGLGPVETAESSTETTYVDTASLHLARQGVSLRRQEADGQTGWEAYLPTASSLEVVTADGAGSAVPDKLSALMNGLRGGEELRPLATLTRTVTEQRIPGETGGPLARTRDVNTSATTFGDEARMSSWRTYEVTLDPMAPKKLGKRLRRQLAESGAEPADQLSDLDRALGRRPGSTGPEAVPAEPGTIGSLIWHYLAEQCTEITRCDLVFRQGQPEIHQFRVALRRLRSTLRVFAPVLDAEQVAGLEPELEWLAGLLGEVRDRDVLRARLVGLVDELPPEMVFGPVAADIETTLLTERSHHLARVAEALDSDRYQELVELLLQWRTETPLTSAGAQPAAQAGRYVFRAHKVVQKRLARSDGALGSLHGARKAAKRARYAAELVEPAAGKSATKLVRKTTKLQTRLGEHRDSVISAAFLRRMGAAAGANGENGFTYGILLAQEWERAERVRVEAERRWGRSARGR